MSRAETSSDVFNALAKPRRREVLVLLADTEKHVGDIGCSVANRAAVNLETSRVVRQVGMARARRVGRHRLYRANADAVRPPYEYARTFERY